MKQFTYTITDALGIHARPAGQLAKLSAGFKSKITLNAPNGQADAKRIMAVMRLAVKSGMEVTFTCEGEDEEAACTALSTFLTENL